ncbi:MAG TPA: hypothetical protein VGE12_18665 [Noviherbaspirillum sp.]
MTAFADIADKFVELFEAAPAVCSQVFRARSREIAEQHSEAVNVYFEGADPNAGAITGAPVDWVSRIVVECYGRTSTTTADLAVDPLIGKVYAKLAADTTLGGLVDNVGVPTIDTEYNNLGQKTGWVRMTYPVEHRTSNATVD